MRRVRMGKTRSRGGIPGVARKTGDCGRGVGGAYQAHEVAGRGGVGSYQLLGPHLLSQALHNGLPIFFTDETCPLGFIVVRQRGDVGVPLRRRESIVASVKELLQEDGVRRKHFGDGSIGCDVLSARMGRLVVVVVSVVAALNGFVALRVWACGCGCSCGCSCACSFFPAALHHWRGVYAMRGASRGASEGALCFFAAAEIFRRQWRAGAQQVQFSFLGVRETSFDRSAGSRGKI
jgi:hypothetical protein